MIFYFVRHGETDWNVKKKIQGKTDIPLNENGWQQAKKLAEELCKKQQVGEFHAVCAYTSPQLRASKTAEVMADALGIPCVELDGLKEMDLGEWEGLKWDFIKEEYEEIYAYWNTHRRYTHTPGGESYHEVLGRTLDALKIILERETDDVIVVSHSAIFMALRCYLAELPFEEMVTHFKTKNAGVVEIRREEIERAIERFRAGE